MVAGFKRLALLALGSFAIVDASPVSAKRQSTNYVTDGSFEDVPDRIAKNFVFNVRAGGWQVRERCIFDRNQPGITAQDGTKFVVYYNSHKTDTRGYVSQDFENMPVGSPLTLTYYYNVAFNNNPSCIFRVTFGSQTLDSFVPPTVNGGTGWIQRTSSFTASTSAGTLKLRLLCPRTDPRSVWEIDLDNISITDS